MVVYTVRTTIINEDGKYKTSSLMDKGYTEAWINKLTEKSRRIVINRRESERIIEIRAYFKEGVF